MNIISEPYIFSFILSLIVSAAYYFYKKNKVDDDDSEKSSNLITSTIIVLLLSYIIIMILYYSYKYISYDFKSSLPLMAGGAKILSNPEKKENIEAILQKREKIAERLTIVDDDIDVSILED